PVLHQRRVQAVLAEVVELIGKLVFVQPGAGLLHAVAVGDAVQDCHRRVSSSRRVRIFCCRASASAASRSGWPLASVMKTTSSTFSPSVVILALSSVMSISTKIWAMTANRP